MTSLIDLLISLINIESITPNDAGCQQLIADYLVDCGFSATYYQQNLVSNVIYSIGVGQPHFVFLGHTDVVPAGELSLWSSPPFIATVRDGILFGRGAADMKSGIAAFAHAAKRFIQQTNKFTGKISIILTSDEEGIAEDGIKHLVALNANDSKILRDIDYCLVGEASSKTKICDSIKIGRKGSMHGKLTIFGRQGHIAFPQRFDNPIHKLTSIINDLTRLNWDKGSATFSPSSLQVYRLEAGVLDAENLIPQTATCHFNFRFNDLVTPQLLQDKFADFMQQYKVKFAIDWRVSGYPSATTSGKLLECTQRAITEELSYKPKLATDGGTSDARFLVDLCPEILELGPLDSTIHAIDENIPITHIETLSKVYLNILHNIFKS